MSQAIFVFISYFFKIGVFLGILGKPAFENTFLKQKHFVDSPETEKKANRDDVG